MLKVESYDDVSFALGYSSFLGSPLKACFYLVDGLLIDTGPRIMANDSLPYLEESKIEQVALTHFHEDHCGLSHWLNQNKSASIFVHPCAVRSTTQRKQLPWHRRKSWGVPEPFISKSIPDSLETNRHIFKIIDTPGHCEDHVVLWEKSCGWLFTGDLYVNSAPIQWAPYESAADTIQSLNRIMQLDFDTLFCGHAGVRSNGKQLIQNKLDYLIDLQDSVRTLALKGCPAREIDRRLFPKKPFSTYLTKGEWSSYHLVSSMLRSIKDPVRSSHVG